MNRDEILKMEAGRDMDALVAEKVMVWEIQGNIILMPDGDFNYLVPDLGGHWSPSTNIFAAWEVVEKMMKNGVCKVSNGDGDSCDVDFFGSGFMVTNWGIASVSENTFPLAICRAALLAVIE